MCRHGMAFYEQCALCCPPKLVSNFARRARTAAAEAKKAERKALRAKAKAEEKAERERRLYNMILKCELYMGDMLGEYAISECGPDGCEKLSSGAWSPSKAVIDDCMREAVYAAYANKLDDRTREDLIRLWKKHAWN